MPEVVDQTGKKLSVETPRRIISLVPSQSEFLWDLGLREELVGITKFCIHPGEMHKKVKRVGGTKTLDMGLIRSLEPDLIIGNKEENEKSQIELLRNEFNVWMSDIYTLEDALAMMSAIGKMTGKISAAGKIVANIRSSFDRIGKVFSGERVVYFIWKDPYMCAASDTFIHNVLRHLGLTNALADQSRYPSLTAADLAALDPEFCFLSSEPFPFKEKHMHELQKILPGTKIMIVDGEMFSWYGSRLLKVEEYVRQQLLKEIKE